MDDVDDIVLRSSKLAERELKRLAPRLVALGPGVEPDVELASVGHESKKCGRSVAIWGNGRSRISGRAAGATPSAAAVLACTAGSSAGGQAFRLMSHVAPGG